jgi:hypothetical protein
VLGGMAATDWKIKVEVLAALKALATKLFETPAALTSERIQQAFHELARSHTDNQGRGLPPPFVGCDKLAKSWIAPYCFFFRKTHAPLFFFFGG